jgi:hypothetical protein
VGEEEMWKLRKGMEEERERERERERNRLTQVGL